MKLVSVRLSEQIQWKNNQWTGNVVINSMVEIYYFIISKGKLRFEIDYGNSPYSRKDTDLLLSKAMEQIEVKKSLQNMYEITKTLNQLKTFEKNNTSKFELKNYQKIKQIEYFDFHFINTKVLFHYQFDSIYKIIKSTATLHDKKPLIVSFSSNYSDEVNQIIIEELRKKPKARIRRMFI